MEVINYEERYPTVVTSENTQQHFAIRPVAETEESSPKYTSYSQYPLDYKKPVTPLSQEDSYPEVVTPLESYEASLNPLYAHAVPPLEEAKHGPGGGLWGIGGISTEKSYCGLKRKIFLIEAVVFLVVIASVVGGVIGGVLARKNKESTNNFNSGTGGSGSNETVTVSASIVVQTNSLGVSIGVSTVPATTTTIARTSGVVTSTAAPTLDTTKAIGSLAVSTFQDNNSKVYIHLYYQQGSSIMVRTYPGSGSFSEAEALTLTVAPKTGSPLAAVEYTQSATNHLSLFYMDTYNNIICANFTSATSGTSLVQAKTVIAATNATVHASSQLAAVYIVSGYRVYHQTTTGTLQELVGTGTSWRAGASLVAKAIGGSPLSVSMASNAKMNVFYVDSTTTSLSWISYDGGWSTPAALSSTPLTAFDGTTTALAAIAETDPSYLRTYYIGNDTEVYEMLGPATMNGFSWKPNSDQSHIWPTADSNSVGSLVGIGWEDQVRLYYVMGGKIEQLNLSNKTWTASNNIG